MVIHVTDDQLSLLFELVYSALELAEIRVEGHDPDAPEELVKLNDLLRTLHLHRLKET